MRLYPRSWRERYGEEFESLLESSASDGANVANVMAAAIRERMLPTRGGSMNQQLCSFGVIAQKPSALVPIAMSLTALVLVMGHIAIYGAAREADEGTTAHLWQLLMGGQVPVLLYFAIKWLPRAPRQTLYVLALQTGAALASVAPVFYFNL
jgi:hypothetical protein